MRFPTSCNLKSSRDSRSEVQTDLLILGGGIAGLSLAYFLDREAVVLEREKRVGGLGRSYALNGVAYDIGPHIIFSKNKEILDLHTTLIQTNRIRRSNQIVYDGRFIKYPFENDLASLDPADRDYCLSEFLNNPYEKYVHTNMLQFFLKTFGEGITRLYLAPYNEKIWKFDPSCLDTQMVERIPKPPREDILASARGVSTEGYLHQLYFNYPKAGGFQSLIDAYSRGVEKRNHKILTNVQMRALVREDWGWRAETSSGTIRCGQLVNCMPIHELATYLAPPEPVSTALSRLLYNSIHVVVVQAKADAVGDHFALYVPDKDIIFHRLSKLNFLGNAYRPPSVGSTLLAEITFRPGSYLSSLSACDIVNRTIDGLERLGFVDRANVTDTAVRTEKYAYVIYDLNHRKNVDVVLGWLSEQGIRSVGRFAEFEYLNTDGVAERALTLARQLNRTARRRTALKSRSYK
jgi:protoporphyrinogen oxidase